jgi:hypothetical protein
MKIFIAFLPLILAGQIIAQETRLGTKEVTAPFKWTGNIPSGIPFKKSDKFSEIIFTDRYANYTNGDTWYPTWAEDGNLYSPWTDGYILDNNQSAYVPFDKAHPDYPCNSLDYMGRAAATGQAKITGNDPLNLKIENLKPRIEASPLPYGGRYPCGSLIYNGVWYYGTYSLTNNQNNNCNGVGWTEFGPFVGFRISTDYGKTWTESKSTPSNPLFGENPGKAKVKIGAPHFVDFGKNMENSPDGFAYLIAHGSTNPLSCNNWIQGDQIYLVRVKPGIENMNNNKAYEYYSGKGPEGNSVWTKDFEKMKPLLEWEGYLGCVTITYNPGLKRYLMCVTRGHKNIKINEQWVDNQYDTMILEAQSLTGDWKLIKYLDRFGPVAYFVNIPSKFISPDGKKMWLSYSANWMDKNMNGKPVGSYYSFSLHEIILAE